MIYPTMDMRRTVELVAKFCVTMMKLGLAEDRDAATIITGIRDGSKREKTQTKNG